VVDEDEQMGTWGAARLSIRVHVATFVFMSPARRNFFPKQRRL
jgi:hypothetical protein